jgi:ABC-type antimicrobial peptide transport system permease subunit
LDQHLGGFVSAYYSPASMSVFVHTSAGEPTALAEPARRIIRELGPAVPIGRARTMSEIVDAALARDRFTLLLLGLFAGVALALAAVGVYGVTAQAELARTREMGLRMAVGAASGRLARGVLAEAMVMATWGVGVGLLGGIALSRLLRAALYGIGPLDPWALAGTAPTLALVVALASLLPAWRAARLDPVEALRER